MEAAERQKQTYRSVWEEGKTLSREGFLENGSRARI